MTVRNPGAEDDLPDHVARWLEAVSRRLSSDIGARHEEFTDQGLRGSQRRILQMIPPQGVRITDLARTAGMTKQSLGEFVDSLEASGFAVSSRDPADGRVRLVSRTQAGDAAAAETQQVIEAVERSWRMEIGDDAFDAMKQALRQLGRGALT